MQSDQSVCVSVLSVCVTCVLTALVSCAGPVSCASHAPSHPGYYNLGDHSIQRQLVPLLYAVMHVALYVFCWLPVPFMRGVWRDVARAFPLYVFHAHALHAQAIWRKRARKVRGYCACI